MNIPAEAENMGELIADCADIPPALRTTDVRPVPVPGPRSWTVDDACHAQVAEIDAYV